MRIGLLRVGARWAGLPLKTTACAGQNTLVHFLPTAAVWLRVVVDEPLAVSHVDRAAIALSPPGTESRSDARHQSGWSGPHTLRVRASAARRRMCGCALQLQL